MRLFQPFVHGVGSGIHHQNVSIPTTVSSRAAATMTITIKNNGAVDLTSGLQR